MKRPTDQHYAESHSLTHLAHRWHVQRRDVKQLLKKGVLPFVDECGQLRVPHDAVQQIETSNPRGKPRHRKKQNSFHHS